MSQLTASDYPALLTEIKDRTRRAQYQALRAANKELFSLSWDLGESIHQKQEVSGWGKAVVQTLADDLQVEFSGRNGFSAANLWLMRQFYPEYLSRPILEPLVREISWSVDAATLDRKTWDLSVKNPNGGEEIAHRSPAAIMDEIAALDVESAEVLMDIRELP